MKFSKDQILGAIPYPQKKDPTNCVIYSLMNLFGKEEPFLQFKKESDGHDLNDEVASLNKVKDLWVGDNDLHIFPYKLASNGGHLYDGLTIGQLQGALDFWDYSHYDCKDWFIAVSVTVASRFNIYGRHQVSIYYDGKGGGKRANLILCDPQIDNYVKLEGVHELLAFYRTVMEIDIVAYVDDGGLKALYFKKKSFSHIPFEALKEED